MMGVCFIVQSIEYNNNNNQIKKEEEEEENNKLQQNKVNEDPYGPIGGQIISTTKEICQKSFLGCEPRLV